MSTSDNSDNPRVALVYRWSDQSADRHLYRYDMRDPTRVDWVRITIVSSAKSVGTFSQFRNACFAHAALENAI